MTAPGLASSRRPRTRRVDSMMPLPVTTIRPTMSTVHFCSSDAVNVGGSAVSSPSRAVSWSNTARDAGEPRDRQPADADRLEVLLRGAQRRQHVVGDAAAVAVGLGQGARGSAARAPVRRAPAPSRACAAAAGRGRRPAVAAVSWPMPLCTRPTSRASGAVSARSASMAECVWPMRRVESNAGPPMASAVPASIVERRTASPTTTDRFARTSPSSTEPVTSIEPGLRQLAARRGHVALVDVRRGHRDDAVDEARVAVERGDDAAVRLDDGAVADAQLASAAGRRRRSPGR